MAKLVTRIAHENTIVWMKEIAEQAGSSDTILFPGITSYVGLSVAEHAYPLV